MKKYTKNIKDKLHTAKISKDKKALKKIEKSLLNLKDVKPDILIALFLSYRDIKAYKQMIKLVKKMPKALKRTIMIQEQKALALNRIGRQDEAIKVLENIIKTHGKSSETCGILGRVYKDKYNEALKDDQAIKAKEYLKKAIDTYLDGFEADFSDPYPGINALTLMDINQDERFDEVYPVVLYAVKQKMKNSSDYWDYATLLELYVLKGDEVNVKKILADVVAHKRFDWEIETTTNNLILIQNNKEKNGDTNPIYGFIINTLKSL